MSGPQRVRGRWIIPGARDAALADGAELVTRLLAHLEAWYRQWDVPSPEPWIRYRSRR